MLYFYLIAEIEGFSQICIPLQCKILVKNERTHKSQKVFTNKS